MAAISNFIREILSGTDNQTPAIGRVLGLVVFVNLLLILPAIVVGAMVARHVDPKDWFGLFQALQGYVPIVVIAVVGLVSGTAFTEPKPPTK